jgi:hypothetical protein
MGYKEDLASAMKRQNDLIVQQVLLQVISVVAESETYDEFRKRMYSIALGYLKDMEGMGVTPDTVNKLTKTVDDKFGGSGSDDEGILF